MPKIYFTTLFCLLLAALTLPAAWEDTGVPARQVAPAPQPQPTVRPQARPAPQYQAPQARPAPQYQTPQQPVQRPLYVAPPPPPPPARYDYQEPYIPPRRSNSLTPPDLYSPFLDAPTEPLGWYGFMYASAADVNGSEKDMAMGEVEGRYNLAQWRNVIGGDIDVDLRIKSVIFGGKAGYTMMPRALLELPLDVDWTWRYLNGFSLELGMRPGIYADIEELGEGWSIPFKGVVYYAVNPELSWMLGMEVRPGWDMPVMPVVGLAWQPSEYFRLIAALPESRAQLQLGPVGLYGRFAWRNTTYGMSGKDGDPDDLTLENLLLGGGLSIAFSENFRLGVEGGVLMERTMKAEGNSRKETLGLDDAPYIRVTIGGAF